MTTTNEELHARAQTEVYRTRLLNVAKALRESKNPDQFTMTRWVHDCGTPACAMGHYASRTDLQDEFRIDLGCVVLQHVHEKFTADAMAVHFGLSLYENMTLFSASGCGWAETANEAAGYIERFVARKYDRA